MIWMSGKFLSSNWRLQAPTPPPLPPWPLKPKEERRFRAFSANLFQPPPPPLSSRSKIQICLPAQHKQIYGNTQLHVAPYPLQKISFFWWWRNPVKSSMPSKWGGQARSDRGGTTPHWNSPTFCLLPIYFSCMETFTITQLNLIFVPHCCNRLTLQLQQLVGLNLG